jgi:hypothetical protein
MRKCKEMSKAAMKANRAHAEILVQYGRPHVQIHTHILQKAPKLDKEIRLHPP